MKSLPSRVCQVPLSATPVSGRSLQACMQQSLKAAGEAQCRQDFQTSQ